MSVIEHRGKDKDSKWRYGYLHECKGIATIDIGHDLKDIVSFNHSWILEPKLPTDSGWRISDTFMEHDVFPSTIGRYTEIMDVNGTKIFENDIVSVCDSMDVYFTPYTGKVVMHKGGWGVEYYEGEQRIFRILEFDGLFARKIEVIGNFHDNPELLEKSKYDKKTRFEVGEEFQMGLIKMKCVKQEGNSPCDPCDGCFFVNKNSDTGCLADIRMVGGCRSYEREDDENVIFVKI